MIRRRRTACLVAAVAAGLLAAGAASADSWAAPRATNVFSASGQYFVRIVPGESIGESVGFAGAKQGGHATAELFARRPDRSYGLAADLALVNPVAPVEAFLSDEGRLVTFDNWHNLGYGKVVAVYGPDGKLVRAYELGELVGAGRIDQVKHSVSSRHWRCAPTYLNPDQRTAYFADTFGDEYVLDLASGSFRRHVSTRKDCAKRSG